MHSEILVPFYVVYMDYDEGELQSFRDAGFRLARQLISMYKVNTGISFTSDSTTNLCETET